MSTDSKAVIRRLFDEILNGGKLELLDRLIGADYVEHNPSPGQAAGAAGVRDNVGAHVTRHDQNHPDLRRIAAQVFDQRLGEALDGELRRGVGIVRHAGA